MGRAPCCDKAKVKRGPWSAEEDTILKNYIEKLGTGGNWIALPQKAGAGLKRCGKSCRLRWLNYLRPDIKHGGFTEEEDNIILTLYSNIGSRWSVIASQLPGRTDNDVKNYWNTKLKKKLLADGKTSHNAAAATNTITTINSFCYGMSACSDSNATTMPSYINMDRQENLFPNFLVPTPIQFPLPGLVEVEESTRAYSNFSTTVSSSQEMSSVSPSFSLENSTYYASWSGNGGGEDGGFFVDLGSDSPFDLLNCFDFQQK